MPVGQVNNSQMKDILDSEFQRSSDPSFLARIAVSKYLNLPGIRGFWGPAVKLGAQGGIYATDMTGATNHMLWADDALFYPQLGRLAWYLDGARYAYNLDQPQWDITAAEAWSGYPGLSLGAWIYPTRALPFATNEGIIGKWLAAGNQMSYLLEINPTINNRVSFDLSSTGANVYAFDHTKVLARDRWYFVAATYNPGAILGEAAGVRVWVNDQMEYHAASDRGVAGLPASIFNSTANLQLASFGGAAYQFLGNQTNWWICGNYLLQGEIYNIYESTKTLFGYVNEFGTSW